MKRTIAAIVLLAWLTVLSVLSVVAVPKPTSKTSNIANTSTLITLDSAANHLVVKTSPGAATIYVDINSGTATTGNFQIDPGGGNAWDNLPSITTFTYIGSANSGTISYTAWYQ